MDFLVNIGPIILAGVLFAWGLRRYLKSETHKAEIARAAAAETAAMEASKPIQAAWDDQHPLLAMLAYFVFLYGLWFCTGPSGKLFSLDVDVGMIKAATFLHLPVPCDLPSRRGVSIDAINLLPERCRATDNNKP